MADQSSTTLAIVPPVGPNQYNPKAAEDFPIGTPLCQLVAAGHPGEVGKASSAASDTSSVVGLAAANGFTDRNVHTQFAGPLTLTTAQWDAITGDSGGLEQGAPYYLDVDGTIDTAEHQDEAGLVTQVGIATSPTNLLVQITRRLATGG